jgi:HEAT repeat protein
MMFFRVNLSTIQKPAVARIGAMFLIFIATGSGIVFHQKSSAAQDGSASEQFRKNQLARLSFVQEGKDGDPAAKSLRKGRDLIEEEKWQEAEKSFKDFIAGFPRHRNVDAALYWLAFSLKKQGRLQDADHTLEQLMQAHAKSSWKDDAQAMRLELAPQLGNQTTINQALDESKGDGNEEMKLIALQSLAFTNPERALPMLQEILKPESKASKSLKHSAIALLAQRGNAQAIDALIGIAGNPSDKELGHTATIWLGLSGDDRAFDYLKEVVATGKDKSLVEVSIVAISQSRNPKAKVYLLELARSAPSPETRRKAIMHLGTRGDDAVIDELLSLYDGESNTETRKQILTALAISGNARVQAKLLEIVRREADVEIRKTAIFWFAQRGGESAVETLNQIYDAEQNQSVKEQLIFALSQSRSKSALQKLMQIAKTDSSLELRKKAIFWLGQSRDPEAKKFIEELLK